MNKLGMLWATALSAFVGGLIYKAGQGDGQKEGVDVGLTIGVAIGQELVNGNAETKTEVKESSE